LFSALVSTTCLNLNPLAPCHVLQQASTEGGGVVMPGVSGGAIVGDGLARDGADGFDESSVNDQPPSPSASRGPSAPPSPSGMARSLGHDSNGGHGAGSVDAAGRRGSWSAQAGGAGPGYATAGPGFAGAATTPAAVPPTLQEQLAFVDADMAAALAAAVAGTLVAPPAAARRGAPSTVAAAGAGGGGIDAGIFSSSAFNQGVQSPSRDVVRPPDPVVDVLHVIVNNVTEANVDEQASKARSVMVPEFAPWFSHYLVSSRVSTQHNYQGVYRSLVRRRVSVSLSVAPSCAVAHCAVLCCAVLCCAVRCGAVLCCAVLCGGVLCTWL
jgi:hypothetical protein